METPIDGLFSNECLSIHNCCRVIATWSRKMSKVFEEILRFFSTELYKFPLTGKFVQICSERIQSDTNRLLCSNFVKFGWWEIGKSCVIYLTKGQNFAWLSPSRYCAECAQNLPGPAPDDVLRVLQVSSKSVHFRRDYSRTHKHRWNPP